MVAAPKSSRATPAKKPKTAIKRPRLSRSDAEARMLQATIRLLLSHPPAEITVHMISGEAGVHHDYIARYFKSREELFIRAVEMVMTGIFAEAHMSGGNKLLQGLIPEADLFKMDTIRYRLITYLLACGVEPKRFVEIQQIAIENAMALFTNPELTERTKRNFTLICILLLQAIHIMSEANGMTQQEIEDINYFIINSGKITPTVQTAMGWDKPVPKKRK